MNKAELIKELKNIGLEEGMEIEVHSSLSSFGHVEGGAETVIEALMECVTERWKSVIAWCRYLQINGNALYGRCYAKRNQ